MFRKIIAHLSGSYNSSKEVSSSESKNTYKGKYVSNPKKLGNPLEPVPEEMQKMARALVASRDAKETEALMKKMAPGKRPSSKRATEVFTKRELESARKKGEKGTQELYSLFIRRRP